MRSMLGSSVAAEWRSQCAADRRPPSENSLNSEYKIENSGVRILSYSPQTSRRTIRSIERECPGAGATVTTPLAARRAEVRPRLRVEAIGSGTVAETSRSTRSRRRLARRRLEEARSAPTVVSPSPCGSGTAHVRPAVGDGIGEALDLDAARWPTDEERLERVGVDGPHPRRQ